MVEGKEVHTAAIPFDSPAERPRTTSPRFPIGTIVPDLPIVVNTQPHCYGGACHGLDEASETCGALVA